MSLCMVDAHETPGMCCASEQPDEKTSSVPMVEQVKPDRRMCIILEEKERTLYYQDLVSV